MAVCKSVNTIWLPSQTLNDKTFAKVAKTFLSSSWPVGVRADTLSDFRHELYSGLRSGVLTTQQMDATEQLLFLTQHRPSEGTFGVNEVRD